MANQPAKSTPFSSARKLARYRAVEFNVISNFHLGYRNREDITNLAPGVLVAGSQNVLTNLSDRVQSRQGYTLDGSAGTNQNSGIIGSFDWGRQTGDTRHLRSFMLDAGTANLQYRYVDANGVVTWRNILTGLSAPIKNFCDFWILTLRKRRYC